MYRKRSISLGILVRLSFSLMLLIGLSVATGGLTHPAAAATPPTLNLPNPITASATSPAGTTVNYTVTASDPVYSADQLSVSCTPNSGSTFAIGTTTVLCSATNPSGDVATGSFSVVVKPLLTVSGMSVSASEGSAESFVVATGTATTGPLTASIDWGDGSSSTVTVTPAADGSYSVSASHTYAEEGQDTIHIVVSDGSGYSTSTTSPASISDASLTLKHFAAGSGKHLTAGLATLFTDADPAGQGSDYTASINWGDGTTSKGLIAKNPWAQALSLPGLTSMLNRGRTE